MPRSRESIMRSGAIRHLGIFLILILVVAVVFWGLFSRDPGDDDPSRFDSPRLKDAITDNDSVEEKPVDIIDIEHSQSSTSEGASRETVAPSGLLLRGRVVDKVSRQAVTRFHVRLFRNLPEEENPRNRRKRVATETFHDDKGRFDLPIDEGGSFRLMVYSSRHCSAKLDPLEIGAGRSPDEVVVELDRGTRITGRVVDDATGQPLAGAILGTQYDTLIMIEKGEGDRTPYAESDEKGCFTLGGLRGDKKITIGAVHPHYAQEKTVREPGDRSPVEFRLKKGPRVFGTVRDDDDALCEGAWVILLGEQNFVYRVVETDAAGFYRTPPSLRGKVQVSARAPDSSEEQFNVTTEYRSAELADADLEINFGPSPEHASWKGTFYGYDGETQGGGTVLLARDWRESDYERGFLGNMVYSGCDEKGGFEFKRLPPGAFGVWLNLNNGESVSDWKQTVFDPGEERREDIRLDQADGVPFGEISGTIVDSRTGRRPTASFISIFAYRRANNFESFQGNADKEGNFRVKGLPPGTYELSIYAQDYPSKSVSGIEVKEGESVDDLRVEVDPGGFLRISMSGFADFESKRFRLHLRREDGKSRDFGRKQIDEKGAWKTRMPIAAGAWVVTVTFDEAGIVERSIDVAVGGDVAVSLVPDDFAFFEGEVTLDGALSYSSGRPAPGIALRFSGVQVPGLAESEKKKTVTTDAAGLFVLGGFKPGRWEISTDLEEGTTVNFPDLSIPDDPHDPFPFHLIFPEGTVTGTLLDDLTGQPLATQVESWMVSVRDAKTNRSVSFRAEMAQSSFNLPGVTRGEYWLSVYAGGFEWYTSAIFTHTGAGAVDLGIVRIKRCGVLRIKVFDPSGKPLANCTFYCDDATVYPRNRHEWIEGNYFFDRLPLGDRVIRVLSPEFKDVTRKVSLKPGQVDEIRVVLEPR